MDQRITIFRTYISEKKLEGLLIASPIQIGYLTNYFGFSLVEREAYVLITKKHIYLLTDRRYIHEVTEVCPSVTIKELSADQTLTTHLTNLANAESIHALGFEADVLTVMEYKKCKVPNVKLIPLSLRTQRVQKNTDEIAKIKKACELGDKTFVYIQSKISEGITEKEVAKIMELFVRENNATLSFETIVAFGKNAAIPHHHTDDTQLKFGDEILLDFGIKYENYCSDMTRTIYFKKVSDKQKRIYQTVRSAQKKAIEFLESRIKNHEFIKTMLANVDSIAREYIISEGYPSIPHSLGHGIGLEVHEAPSLSPRSKETLSEGMVFSIEPGIYYPGVGGVRIEDLFAIENGKLIKLTHASSELLVL